MRSAFSNYSSAVAARIAHGLAAAADIGLKAHDRVALARQMMERKLSGRVRHFSKLREQIELTIARPLVPAGMVAATLEVTQQAALRIVGELGLWEMTGRSGSGLGASCERPCAASTTVRGARESLPRQ